MGPARAQRPGVENRRRSAVGERLPLLAALVLSLACAQAQAGQEQQRRRADGPVPPGPIISRQKQQAAAAERRARAITLLSETADRARAIEDLFYRARIQAQAGDALWPFDEERARLIFRRAWEAATEFDRAERERDAAETAAGSPNGADAAQQVTEARREVLSKAAARSTALARSFLKELDAESERQSGESRNQAVQTDPWHEPGASGMRVLALASELLRDGDTERASQLAASVVSEGASASLLTFIMLLHEEDPEAGGELYGRLLKRMSEGPGADINSVLLLSAPIVSPYLLVVVDARGSLQYRPVAYRLPLRHATRPLAQPLRAAFYNLAATVLRRPLNSADEAGASGGRSSVASASAQALYFATGRLLPFFEREAAQYASELHARMEKLASELAETQRSLLSGQAEVRSLSSERASDPLRYEAEQVARAHDAATRDAVLSRLAAAAARRKLWSRAREAAARMEDPDRRGRVQALIAVSQIADLTRAFTDDDETDLDGLAKFVGGAGAPSFARAWGWAQLAELAAKQKNRQRATEFLNEAEREAASTDQGRGTPQRIAAYMAVTTAAARVAPGRVWELLADTVKAINATDDYAGDEQSLELADDESYASERAGEEGFAIDASMFRLDNFFAKMAALDFERALTNARALNDEVPQAIASMAIARAELDRNGSARP